MEWVEVRGETLEQAKEEALDQLGVAADDAEFEIVQEPETRWLGMKKTEARVRARVRPTQPRPKRDSRNGRRSKRGGSQGGQSKQSKKAAAASKSGDQNGSGGGKSSKNDSGSRGGQKATSNKKPGSKGGGSSKQNNGSNARSNGGQKSGSSDRQSQKNTSKEKKMTDNETSGEGPQSEVSSEPMPLEKQEAVVVEFLDGLASGFGVDAEASTSLDDDVIIASVEGSDLGLMIGPKGGTMHAIQELARSAVQRQSEGRSTNRLMVDVAGYRARRREALAEFTRSQAATVLESGEDLALEPMGSADRKAVHDAVLEIDGVRSISEGDEPRRRIVLIRDDN